MKTYPISARFVNNYLGKKYVLPVNAKIIRANGGWYFFEVEHYGETLFSDHGEQTKSGLLETVANDVLEFIL